MLGVASTSGNDMAELSHEERTEVLLDVHGLHSNDFERLRVLVKNALGVKVSKVVISDRVTNSALRSRR